MSGFLALLLISHKSLSRNLLIIPSRSSIEQAGYSGFVLRGAESDATGILSYKKLQESYKNAVSFFRSINAKLAGTCC